MVQRASQMFVKTIKQNNNADFGSDPSNLCLELVTTKSLEKRSRQRNLERAWSDEVTLVDHQINAPFLTNQ